MPFAARCPFCGHTKPLPDKALGAEATCPKCRNQFFAVPDTTAELALSGAVTAPTSRFDDAPEPVRDTNRFTEPAPVPVPLTPPPKPVVTSLPLTEWPDEPEPTRSRGREEMPTPTAALWAGLGASCLLAVATAVAASVSALAFLVIPLALVATVVGGATLYVLVKHQMPGIVLAVPGVATAASAVILLLAVVAPDWLTPQYEQGRLKSTYDPDAVLYLPATGELVDPAKLTPKDGWADASRVACQQGTVRVDVKSAIVGPVELTGGKPPQTKERYLVVQLQIAHVSHGGEAVPFVAWGAAVPRPTPEAKLTAGAKPVGPADLGTRQVAGKIYNGFDLTPTTVVTTKLVFDPPPAGEPLHLELPAEAWHGKGSFKFLIPTAMIAVRPPPR